MSQTLALLVICGAVWFFLLRWRAPATILFFSLLVGQILSTEISGEAYGFVSANFQISEYRFVQLSLLVLPVILSLIFLRHRVPSSKAVIEAIPMFFVVAAAAIFAYPHVPAIQAILENVTNHRVETLKNLIVAAASLSSLISAWFTYPGGIGKRKHKG